MPEPSQQSINHSNYVTLRDYIDSRFTALERATEAARAAMEKRLDGMNEFRDTLKDQGSTFLPRQEFTAFSHSIEAAIRSLELSRSELEGKASQKSLNTTTFFAVAALIMGVISLALELFAK